MYYECLKAPDSLAYNIPAMLVFDMSTSSDMLAKAITSVVAAHPTLSARFVQEGEDVTLVSSDAPVKIERVSCSEEELAAYRDSFVRPFDLATGPLARFAVATTPERTCLLAEVHQLAFDGASMDNFLGELTEALDGAEGAFESYTFADHAKDEQTYAASNEFEETRAYIASLFEEF